jgi:hypothetical protein
MNRIVLIYLIVVIGLWSCVKEEIYTHSDARIEFSTDTVFFDTVFTNVGSTTAYIKIKNPYNESLILSNVRLGKGSNSQFRINVNGFTGESVRNVEIGPKDSLFVLIEVTVRPNDVNAPFVVEDSLVCELNGSVQDLKLRAWGQNAHYIDGRYNGIIQTSTWENDKPYLIYNSMMVDSLQTLTIKPGVKIHFHKNSYLIAKGTLKIQGTFENPVNITGDRLEEAYKDVPGQWGNIILADGSGTHQLSWVNIRNGVIGLQIGSTQNGAKPSVVMGHVKIENMNYAGIFAMASEIEAQNCLIDNCGFYNLALLAGGEYSFKHCTFASYWTSTTRKEPSVLVSNNFTTQEGQFVGDLSKAYFGNCVIYGTQDQELLLSNESSVLFNHSFENCLIRTTDNYTQDIHFSQCIYNTEPKFVDPYEFYFDLDSLSPLINAGSLIISQNADIDLLNQSHSTDGTPDLGAYEYIHMIYPTKK